MLRFYTGKLCSKFYVKLLCFSFIGVIQLIDCSYAQTRAQAENERKRSTAQNQVTNLQRVVSVDLYEVPLDKALEEMAHLFETGLLVNPDILPKKKVTLQLKSVALQEALTRILAGTPVEGFVSNSGNIMIRARGSRDAKEVVSGKITDASSKEPIPGVTILLKGTNKGTVSDLDGNYSLEVPNNEGILVFSSVGYISEEVSVSDQTTINIEMVPDIQQLGEVVITAFGIEREKEAVGYAVQEVEGSNLNKARETNLINTLAGRVAGVNVTRVPGAIGSSARMVIRGENSLTGNNQALFVVDGIPIDNEMRANRGQLDFGNGAGEINPDDIEKISVLKGPAAAALYGSRAANGVVLITTKRGKSHDGFGLSVNSTTSLEIPMLRWELQNEYGQGSGGVYTIGLGGRSWGPKFDPDTLIAQVDRMQFPLEGQEGVLLPWVAQPDNVIDFFRTGKTFTNNIAYAGNTDKVDYRISYTNLYQQSIAPNMSLKRNTIYLNSGYQVSPKMDIRAALSYINTDSPNRTGSGGQGNGNLLYSFLTGGRQTNLERIRNYWVEGYEGLEQWSDNYRVMNNPYFSVHEIINSQNKNRLVGNIRIDYQLTPSLSLMVRTGTDLYFDEREHKEAFSALGSPYGSYRIDNLLFNERNSDFLLSYKTNLSNLFTLNLSVGGNRMYQLVKSSYISADQLNIPGIYNVGNVRGQLDGGNTLRKRRTNSLYGFANISFKDMVFLDITGRNDWSSTLPVENNSYFYPSVSMSFIVSEMLNISSNGFLSFAKLRASFAQVGNDTDPYQLYQNFGYGTSWGGIQTLQESGTIENENLKPEIATNYEIGTDIHFFNNRLRLDLTYYDNSTKNQILAINMTSPTGYASKRINAGKIQSRGVEAILSVTPFQMESGFTWNVELNWSMNRSYVRELAEDIDRYGTAGGGSASVQARVGGLMGDIYARDLLRNENGQVIHENGLPQWTDDVVKMGNYNPKWMAGIYNSLSYKGLSLGVLFDVRHGGKIYSHSYSRGLVWGQFMETLEGREGMIGKGVMDDGEGNWVPNNVEVPGQTYWGNGGGYTSQAGTSILSASYVKLRELQVGYTFPRELLGKSPIQNLSISLVGRDLFLWAKAPHINPDNAQIGGQNFSPGAEMIALPSTRSIGLNLNFNF